MTRISMGRAEDGARCELCDRVIVRVRWSAAREGDRCDRDRYGARMRSDGRSGSHYRFLLGDRFAYRYRDEFGPVYRCLRCVETPEPAYGGEA